MRHPSITPDEARRLAEQVLSSEDAADPFARSEGLLLEALTISAPDGGEAGWMVPIAFGDVLLGFIQLRADGTFHRYASFQRRPGAIESCPETAVWLDRNTISERARATKRDSEMVSEPVLTYERSPDRLVWMVTVADRDGTRARVHVAGDTAWVASDEA